MVKEKVRKKASLKNIELLLKRIEGVGYKTHIKDFSDSILNRFPSNVISNKEYLTRVLLLTAILDQQAESPTARDSALFVCETFKLDLFKNPLTVIYQFSKLEPLLNIYKISPAIGKVTPRFGWIVLRVGGFLIFELQLNYKHRSLYQELSSCSTPKEAFEYLYKSNIIKSLLREKAARMFISWVGHPDLGINVSQGKWKKTDFLMPVDGHVGKVFARTGMLDIIHRESGRKDIIEALKMRDSIQLLVIDKGFDPVMVDHGAFILGYWCCSDQQENASCVTCSKISNCEIKDLIGCPGVCPLAKFCKKNMHWRAY